MVDRVADALLLRAWALRVLSGGWLAPPDADMDTWRLFLRAERCAVALSTRAEGEAPGLLHAAATIELQRILSARAQIEALGRAVAEKGRRVLVLKGGVMALSSPAAVDLVDVDVLAEPGVAAEVAAHLDAQGYVSHGPPAANHLSQRQQPFGVHVEVHHRLGELRADEVWGRARPMAGRPGLWKPAPVDLTWHALAHSAVTHPFRRGALRDLLLIAWADDQCTADERSELGGRLGAAPRRDALREVLRLARDVRDERAPVDLFRREAAAHYVFCLGRPVSEEKGLRAHVVRSVYSRLDGPEGRREYWKSVWVGVSDSPWASLAGLEAVWSLGGRVLRRTLRLARLPLVEVLAARIARRATRLGRRHSASEARTLDIRSGTP